MSDERPDVANPPGRDRLRRRATDYARAMERMRAALAGDDRPPAIRALARHDPDDPGIALLDTWALVADTVSFYSERIAHEGLLRTATQPGSVRELARTVGYELDPGVAAQVYLAFTTDAGPLAPPEVTVPAHTPVQSVPQKAPLDDPPAPEAVPQTFETGTELRAQAAWNALPVLDVREQKIEPVGNDDPSAAAAGATVTPVWLRGPVPVRPGDPVLLTSSTASAVVGTVRDVEPDYHGHAGWTRLTLDGPVPHQPAQPVVHTFARRVRLFGATAPDPALLVVNGKNPSGSDESQSPLQWKKYGIETTDTAMTLELDGDHRDLAVDSWLLVQQPDDPGKAFQISDVTVGGAAKYAISGPLTTVTVTPPGTYPADARRSVTVFCADTAHPAATAPLPDLVPLTPLPVPAHDPPLPRGRLVLVTGRDAQGAPQVRDAVVETCEPDGAGRMTLALSGSPADFDFRGLTVLGNVVAATHGETVRQVLGSGDGSASFATFRLRRGPLTHVLAGALGSRPDLEVRVDGVLWQPVRDLAAAGPGDRVYTLREREDGTAEVGFGDGTTGARPATGSENITARYRVGLGEPGVVPAGRVILPTRRPLGVREVVNPASSSDAAAPEPVTEARTNAPRTVRTLDRAVSLADHEYFAAGFTGVGTARADLIWDGRRQRIVVTVLGEHGLPLSDDFRAGLDEALALARDPVSRLDVRNGERLTFTVEVALKHDPARQRATVLDAAAAALRAAYGPGALPFATAVDAAAVLRTLTAVPGVVACAMPRLLRDGTPATTQTGQPARWDPVAAAPRPAQVLAVEVGADTFRELR